MILRFAIALAAATALHAQMPDVRKPLTEQRIRPAMEQALAGVQAELEILEFSQFPAPEGPVEFPLDGLSPPSTPNGTTRWRGAVRYGPKGDERYSIWAVVRLATTCTRVVAAEKLALGAVLQPAHIREEEYKCFPFAKNTSWTAAEVQRRALSRGVRAGDPIPPSITVEPDAIKRGEQLTVEYRVGTLVLRMPVTAESAGKRGDIISVRNPQTNKSFDARVEGPGLVVITRVP